MPAVHRVILALAILGAGLLAATPFRNSNMAVVAEAGQASDENDVTWRRDDSLLDIPASTPAGDLASNGVTEVSRVEVTIDAAANPWGANRQDAASPMAVRFQELGQPIQPPPVEPEVPRRVTRLPQVENPGLTDSREETSPPQAGRLRRHRVIDGDTLERLADRFLGSAARWSEIFAANRDLLSDPQLLPIGAELRIWIPAAAD